MKLCVLSRIHLNNILENVEITDNDKNGPRFNINEVAIDSFFQALNQQTHICVYFKCDKLYNFSQFPIWKHHCCTRSSV